MLVVECLSVVHRQHRQHCGHAAADCAITISSNLRIELSACKYFAGFCNTCHVMSLILY